MPASADLSYWNTILISVSRVPQDISSLLLDPGFTSLASSDFSPSDSPRHVHGPGELPLKNSRHREKQARLISHPSLLLQLYLLTPKPIYLEWHWGEAVYFQSYPPEGPDTSFHELWLEPTSRSHWLWEFPEGDFLSRKCPVMGNQ